MSALAEIKAAVVSLPIAEKQELLLFIARQLRNQAGTLPAPRKFSSAQIEEWIKEDTLGFSSP